MTDRNTISPRAAEPTPAQIAAAGGALGRWLQESRERDAQFAAQTDAMLAEMRQVAAGKTGDNLERRAA